MTESTHCRPAPIQSIRCAPRFWYPWVALCPEILGCQRGGSDDEYDGAENVSRMENSQDTFLAFVTRGVVSRVRGVIQWLSWQVVICIRRRIVVPTGLSSRPNPSLISYSGEDTRVKSTRQDR